MTKPTYLTPGSGVHISFGNTVMEEITNEITKEVTKMTSTLWVPPKQKASNLLTNITPGPVNTILITDSEKQVKWVSIEEAIIPMLHNPAVRDRIENVIKSVKNLEMTLKLVGDGPVLDVEGR